MSVELCSGQRLLSDHIDEGRLWLGADEAACFPRTESHGSDGGKTGACRAPGCAEGDVEFETVSRGTWKILPDDPLSAHARCDVDIEMMMHGSAGYQVRVETCSVMECTQVRGPLMPDPCLVGMVGQGENTTIVVTGARVSGLA